jgi:hypothetical protein
MITLGWGMIWHSPTNKEWDCLLKVNGWGLRTDGGWEIWGMTSTSRGAREMARAVLADDRYMGVEIRQAGAREDEVEGVDLSCPIIR